MSISPLIEDPRSPPGPGDVASTNNPTTKLPRLAASSTSVRVFLATLPDSKVEAAEPESLSRVRPVSGLELNQCIIIAIFEFEMAQTDQRTITNHFATL